MEDYLVLVIEEGRGVSPKPRKNGLVRRRVASRGWDAESPSGCLYMLAVAETWLSPPLGVTVVSKTRTCCLSRLLSWRSQLDRLTGSLPPLVVDAPELCPRLG